MNEIKERKRTDEPKMRNEKTTDGLHCGNYS